MNAAAHLASLFSVFRCFWSAGVVGLWPAVLLAASAAPTPPPAQSDKFSLTDLLPTAWQKNPRLYFMVNTEVSEGGKKLPEVTPDHPAYFELRVTGYREIGDTPAGHKTLKAEQLEPTLLKALASGGYYRAKEGQAPSLLVVYRWGVHSPLDPETLDQNAVIRNKLDRAEMIGGVKFAEELAAAYRERAIWGSMPTGLPPDAAEFMDPVNILKMKDKKMMLMIDGTGDDIYYIVASAYDYTSMKEGRPVHLWRTRVTVPSTGVTQADTLPTMLVTAGPFFGKETDRAEIVSRRTVPEGSVELGTATVVEPIVPSPPAPVETKK